MSNIDATACGRYAATLPASMSSSDLDEFRLLQRLLSPMMRWEPRRVTPRERRV